jgi:pentapeptide MXKDX repeat protein
LAPVTPKLLCFDSSKQSLREAPILLQRTPRRRQSLSRKSFQAAGNKTCRAAVLNIAASVAFKTASKEDQPMTISTRIALGISAAALSLSLALAPVAFAQDKMGKDDGMKKDSMSKDSMKKDTISKDSMKKDTMSKDSMKKDDAMKKN